MKMTLTPYFAKDAESKYHRKYRPTKILPRLLAILAEQRTKCKRYFVKNAVPQLPRIR